MGIYVWDLQSTVKKINFDRITKGQENKVVEQDVSLVANLKWSDTDNFYMNLGCHKGKGLIACGDDRGSLWLYNLPQFGKDGGKSIEGKVDPTTRLMWPELQDDHLENSRKV